MYYLAHNKPYMKIRTTYSRYKLKERKAARSKATPSQHIFSSSKT